MELLKALGLPEEHHAEIIAAAAVELRKRRNVMLAQNRMKPPKEEPADEDFINQWVRTLLISAWKQAVAEKAKTAIDELLQQ
jgi:hypothetical protein